MNTDSGFLNDFIESSENPYFNPDLGIDPVTAAVTGSQLVKATGIKLPKIFGRGNQGAKRRGQKRAALAKAGFTYENVSGHQSRHDSNIENFDDAGLDNIARAVEEYGQIVVTLHNQGKFHRDAVRSYSTIKNIIEANTPKKPVSNFFNPGKGSANSPGSAAPGKAGFGTPVVNKEILFGVLSVLGMGYAIHKFS